MWSEADSKGLTIPYPNISLHAAQAPGSRGENSRGCIYMQLEGASHLAVESTANGGAHVSTDEQDEDMNELAELNLIPADESTCTCCSDLELILVSAFYEALCACASLHPDPHSVEDDIFGDDHQWITADNFDDAEEGGEDDDTEGNVAKWRRTE